MQTLILTLHIIVCVLLVILVLLQAGKEGMGVIFGGGNSSVFGSGGAGGILAKLTALMAVIFVITSISYTLVTSSRPVSLRFLTSRLKSLLLPGPQPPRLRRFPLHLLLLPSRKRLRPNNRSIRLQLKPRPVLRLFLFA